MCINDANYYCTNYGCVVNTSSFLEFLEKVLTNYLNKVYVFTNSSFDI